MAYKDPDKQREAVCKHCGKGLELVPGKVQKQVCNDACRKAYKRAELKEFEAVAGLSVAEPRTDGTKLTPDNAGQDMLHDYRVLDKCAPPILEPKPKRGKDIKVFADLSPGVQQTIDMMSMAHDKIDPIVKANRMAIAIHYQHLFPDRYHSTGVI